MLVLYVNLKVMITINHQRIALIYFRFDVKRDSRVVSALASCARGPGFDPRRRRGKFVGPSLLPFVSFAGMT